MESETTVVALFDDHMDAERARDALLGMQIDESRLRISAHKGDADDLHPEHTDGGRKLSGFLSTLGSVFIPDFDRDNYAEAVRRGGCILSARVDSQDVDRVCDALEQFGPVDIEERERHWRETGWEGYRADATPYSVEEAAAERTRYRVSAGGLTGQGHATPSTRVRRYSSDTEGEPRMTATSSMRESRAASGRQGFGESSPPDRLTDAMDDEILAADQSQRPDPGAQSRTDRPDEGPVGRPVERMREDELPKAARDRSDQGPRGPRRS